MAIGRARPTGYAVIISLGDGSYNRILRAEKPSVCYDCRSGPLQLSKTAEIETQTSVQK